MLWFIVVLLAGILLALLLMFQQRYEREGVNVALREVEALQEEVDALTRRVRNLEVIAADESETFGTSEAQGNRTSDEGKTSGEDIASEDSSSVSLNRQKDRS